MLELIALSLASLPALEQRSWCATPAFVESRASAEAGTCPLEGECDAPDFRDGYALSRALPKVVQVRILIFREDDGSNPAGTEAEAHAEMAMLNEQFAPFRFRFEYTWEFIDDSEFRHTASFQNDIQMKLAYVDDARHRCHVYVTGSLSSYGTYPWDPRATRPRGGIVMDAHPFGFGTAVLTHEFGHNLGLYHTFHGVQEVDACSPCYERADGLNADTTGDFCADTPATPENVSCNDPTTTDPCSNTAWGDVSEDNYMSYSISCWSEFTPQQAARMHCWAWDELDTWWRCAADIDGDGMIDRADLARLLAAAGPNPGHPADLDGDGVVGIKDARLLVRSARECP